MLYGRPDSFSHVANGLRGGGVPFFFFFSLIVRGALRIFVPNLGRGCPVHVAVGHGRSRTFRPRKRETIFRRGRRLQQTSVRRAVASARLCVCVCVCVRSAAAAARTGVVFSYPDARRARAACVPRTRSLPAAVARRHNGRK